MDCPTVRTLTLNPSIDLSSDVVKVEPVVKLRTTNEEIDAGGGGINVARVLHGLGTAVEAVYLAGGANGHVLDHVLERMGLPHESVPIAGDSRMSHTIHETSTGEEYRFVPEGPLVSAAEVEAAIAAATDCASPWFVASGSLPRGVGADIYARVHGRLGPDIHFVVDTSGKALGEALAAGGIAVVKASREEFAEATGKSFADVRAVAAEARALVAAGKAQMVSVTFGLDGAVLADGDGAWFSPALPVEQKSTVGAGDSFLGGMLHALVEGLGPGEALRWGTAAGGATVAGAGPGLCTGEEVRALLPRIPAPERIS